MYSCVCYLELVQTKLTLRMLYRFKVTWNIFHWRHIRNMSSEERGKLEALRFPMFR